MFNFGSSLYLIHVPSLLRPIMLLGRYLHSTHSFALPRSVLFGFHWICKHHGQTDTHYFIKDFVRVLAAPYTLTGLAITNKGILASICNPP